MNTLTLISISLVIFLHALFLILEMFLWNTAFGRKTFSLTEEYARQSATLAANQGLYNGFMAAGLLWGLLSTAGNNALIFFLSCISGRLLPRKRALMTDLKRQSLDKRIKLRFGLFLTVKY